MAIQHISNVRISGVAVAVPQSTQETKDCPIFECEEDAIRFVENVGIERRRVLADNGITCSDLCLHAAEALFDKEGLGKEDVDLLIFASQSQDYRFPATACVLHGKLGLADTCCAFDLSLGCSSWVYGLSVAAGMMQSGAFKKCLLLAGDTQLGRNAKPIFADAGSATVLAYEPAAPEMIIITQTDGARHEAIIQRGGGMRNPFDEKSLDMITDRWGRHHRIIDTEMDGAAVFVFGISKVPQAVKSMLHLANRTVEDIDYFLFHQANMMMNEQIRKKCKIPAVKCPCILRDFGNCSSASIPLAMVTQIGNELQCEEREIIACGFGMGLSWATVYTRLQCPYIAPLVEI